MRTKYSLQASSGPAPQNGGGWPSKTGNPSGGGRSNNPPSPNKKIMGVGLALIVTMLSACGSAPTWHKHGVSEHDMVSEQSKCQYEISTNKLNHADRKAALTHCMQSKGFRWF